jgi:CheY-like chemotaxis protein
VLHIEDNASNRKLVELVVSRRPNLELVEAPDGETGLELARSLRPDLILLDLRLPGISGEEVLAKLREDSATAGLRVVVISAEARPGETSRLLEAGAERYLVKPVDVEELLAVLESFEAQ